MINHGTSLCDMQPPKLYPPWCSVLGIKKIGILASTLRNLLVKRERLTYSKKKKKIGNFYYMYLK